jgi:hypothetical protein
VTASAVTECLDQVRALISDPALSSAALQSTARRWLEGEGDRYLLLADLRSLLESIVAAPVPINSTTLIQWESRLLDFHGRYFPARNPYLDPVIARTRLIALGLYSEETAPSTAIIATALDRACDLVHQWLGRRLAVTTYQEVIQSDRFGRIRLPISPVLGIESLAIRSPGAISRPLPVSSISGFWQGGRIVGVGFAQASVEVTYTAGIDPLPGAIVDCLIDLLIESISLDPTLSSVDWSRFSMSDYPVQSVELPGGLRKSFAVPTGVALNTKPRPTPLDRLLSPLTNWRVSSVVC